ncbi:hypothetical protein ACS0TY_017791 [Phlomoides rotata]
MAIHLSLRVAPLDLQQGGNSRIPYVHVPAARMSILVYIATAINTLLFLLTKHPLFLRSSGTGTEMGAFSTLFTLVTGGFRGRPMWGTFWVWDARLTSVLISFLIYLGALCFQKLSVELAPISIRAGPIDIPIIKSSVNWWNTSHQPGSISRSGSTRTELKHWVELFFGVRVIAMNSHRLPGKGRRMGPIMGHTMHYRPFDSETELQLLIFRDDNNSGTSEGTSTLLCSAEQLQLCIRDFSSIDETSSLQMRLHLYKRDFNSVDKTLALQTRLQLC